MREGRWVGRVLSYLSCAMGILSPENMLFLGSRRLSRIFLSNFSAIISAAFPLGHLIMGIAPKITIRTPSKQKQVNKNK